MALTKITGSFDRGVLPGETVHASVINKSNQFTLVIPARTDYHVHPRVHRTGPLVLGKCAETPPTERAARSTMPEPVTRTEPFR